MVVMKFGGSCLGCKGDIRKTVELVKSEVMNAKASGEKRNPVIVLSAFKGVTDKLISDAKNALSGNFKTGEIAELHLSLIEDLSASVKAKTLERMGEFQRELDNTLLGISYLKELSPKTFDKVMSFGERMAAQVISANLTESGLESCVLSDSEAGIITDSNHGNASILEDISRPLVKKKILQSCKGGIPVVTGFIGRDEYGSITTLGRGGSDYTASYIASALGCDVILWKDVAGLMTADPKIVKDARVIEKISYLDALELAHYGSKVICEKAIIPAMKSRISLRIRSFMDASERGTCICGKVSNAISISSVKNAVMIDMFGYSPDMMQTISDLFREFALSGIYPLLLTEASSCGETSMVLEGGKAEHLFKKMKMPYGLNVKTNGNVGVVAVIGSGMRKKVGTAAAIFGCLAKNGINIIAIAQTASERNVSVIIDKKHVDTASQALHELFVSGPNAREREK